jgi:hypothetical protein
MRGRLGIGTEGVVHRHFSSPSYPGSLVSTPPGEGRQRVSRGCSRSPPPLPAPRSRSWPGSCSERIQRSPLPRVQVAGAGVRCEAEGGGQAFHVQRGEVRIRGPPNRTRCAKGAREEAPVPLGFLNRHERLWAPLKANDRSIDTRRRREGRSRETARDRHVEPGSPVGALQRGRPDGRLLAGKRPLDDHVDSSGRSSGIPKQLDKDRPGAGKREIGYDREGARRPFPLEHVDLDDCDARVRCQTSPELCSQFRSELERDHLGARVRQGPRQSAGAGADVDDEIAGCDTRLTDDVSCESAATKKVPAGCGPRGSPPNGHGKPPSSSTPV